MPRYVVAHDYESRRDGQQWGPWQAGTGVDLSPEDAGWLNVDSPGVVEVVEPEPIPEPEPEPETPEPAAREKTPAKNRQHTSGSSRSA